MNPLQFADRTQAMGDYLLHGWRVRSELPLPHCLSWEGPDRPVDINVRLGEVPDEVADPIHWTPFLQIAGNGDCRLQVASVGRYLVCHGSEVIVQPASGATPAEIGVFLLGSVIGLLCHQRGLFPLHASCVRIGEGAVAFCGASGAGKSTLAASLALRGHPLLCDDITIVDSTVPGSPLVFPATPRIRLWRDSLAALDVSGVSLQQDRVQLEKYVVGATEIGRFSVEPVPLKAIFLLRTVKSPALEGTSVLPPMEAVAQLSEEIYRRRQGAVLGRKTELFHGAARVAGKVPVLRLAKQCDFAALGRTVAMVERVVGACPGFH